MQQPSISASFQRESCHHDATHIESVHASLKACITTRDLRWGKEIHSRALEKNGAMVLSGNVTLANSLITMYCKCGALDDARGVFDGMLLRDVVSWNALMQGYVDAGQGGQALEIFSRMVQGCGCDPDARSFVAAIKACSSELQEGESPLSTNLDNLDGMKKIVITRGKALDRGRWIHSLAAKFGCESNMFVSSTLIDFYAKYGSLVDARRVFHRMRARDVVAWNAIILGHAENEEPGLALEFFSSMQREGSVPNSRTFVAAIKACAVLAESEPSSRVREKFGDAELLVKMASLERGMALHSQAVRSGSGWDIFVRNMLVDMYAKCGDLEDSRRVFEKSLHRDVVSWNAMILGYAGNGEEHLALELFSSLAKPSSRSFVAALKACSALAAKEQGRDFDGKAGIKIDSLEKGMAVHAGAAISGYELDHFVANTLIDMYVKCGSTEDGHSVFEKIPHRSTVPWSVLILGYANNGQGELGLELFLQEIMEQTRGFTPTVQAYNAALKACASLASLRSSRFVHGEICKSGCESIPVLGTSLVDTYGKCGSASEAQRVFDLLARNDVVSWTALISGYAHQGDTDMVLCWFHRMRDEGIQANEVTLLCLLTACSRAGLIDRGRRYFEAMIPKFGVTPSIEHFHCMVDMLGRANALEEAVSVVSSMPFPASSVSWMTVLDGCRKWKNVEVGKLAFESLLELDEGDCGAYVVMASIYESAGMFEQQLEVVEAAAVRAKNTRELGENDL